MRAFLRLVDAISFRAGEPINRWAIGRQINPYAPERNRGWRRMVALVIERVGLGQRWLYNTARPCGVCHATGKFEGRTCWRCCGSGRAPKKRAAV